MVNPLEKTAVIAGSKNSIITVNNIRRDKGYISLLTPKDIERVEIIRHPGSRYKDVDGIINIVTKVPARGQSLELFGRLDPALEQGYFNGSYKLVGSKVSGSIYAQHFFFDDANAAESIVRDVSVGNSLIRHTERKGSAGSSSYINTYISANIDYTISPKNFVSLGLDYSLTPTGGEAPYKGSVLYSDGQGYEFDAYNKYKSDYDTYKLFLYYQSDFSEKSSMSIDVNYDIASTKTNTLYNESNNSGHFYEMRRISNTGKQGMETQVNFQQQLSKVKLEEGYRVYMDDNVIDNETNGVFNKTEHNEWRHYLYANLLGDIREKFVYQAGAGIDMTRVTLDNALSTNNEITPNAMLRYIFKGGQNIRFNYSLTRKSPASSALNPIPRYVDSSRIVTGNPGLKPFYLNELWLNYELSKNKIFIQSSLNYNSAKNYITLQENLDENGVYHVTYLNASRYSSALVSLFASYNIFNWWRISALGSMRYNMYEDDNVQQLNKNFWTPYLNFYSSVNYKKLAVSMYYTVYFREKTLTGYSTGSGDSNIYASYRLNNSWTLIGMIRQLSPLRFKTETFVDGFSEVFYSNMHDRYLKVILGIRYNFQKGKQQQNRQKRVKNYNDKVNIETKSY
jgi:hypothetical protein